MSQSPQGGIWAKPADSKPAAKPDTEIVQHGEQTPQLSPPRLPYHPAVQDRFGVDRASWKALVEAVFPNAQTVESVILALSYCRARKLDPFKKNVHIVPIWSKDLGRMVDTVWPGIGELRTTAFRTGQYAGRDDAQFGPDVADDFGSSRTFEFPAWCQVTVYRLVQGQRVAFAGPKVFWRETYATAKRDSDVPNEMWATRPFGQIEKCAEAAALRAAFPEEIGTEYIPEEVEHAPVKSVRNTAASDTQAEIDALKAKQEAAKAAQQTTQVPSGGGQDAPSVPVDATKGNPKSGDTGAATDQAEKERRQKLPISHPDALPPDEEAPWNT